MFAHKSTAEFIDSRSKLLRWWPLVVGISAVLILGLAIWLVLTAPLLANPFHTLEELEKDAVEPGTLVLMAAMVPILVLVIVFLLVVLVIFMADAMMRERKYLSILSRAGGSDQALPPGR